MPIPIAASVLLHTICRSVGCRYRVRKFSRELFDVHRSCRDNIILTPTVWRLIPSVIRCIELEESEYERLRAGIAVHLTVKTSRTLARLVMFSSVLAKFCRGSSCRLMPNSTVPITPTRDVCHLNRPIPLSFLNKAWRLRECLVAALVDDVLSGIQAPVALDERGDEAPWAAVTSRERP